jgi:hypothetical protein
MRHPFDQEALLCAAALVSADAEEKLSDSDIATVVIGMDSYIQAAWDSLVERKLVDQHERIKQLEKQGSVFSEFCSMKTQGALLHFGEMNAGELRLFKALQGYLERKISRQSKVSQGAMQVP